MTQHEIREHTALIIARQDRDNAVAEAEMSYLTTAVQAVARRVGFLTRADVQALEQNVQRMLETQSNTINDHLEAHSRRLDAQGQRLDTHFEQMGDVRALVAAQEARLTTVEATAHPTDLTIIKNLTDHMVHAKGWMEGTDRRIASITDDTAGLLDEFAERLAKVEAFLSSFTKFVR